MRLKPSNSTMGRGLPGALRMASRGAFTFAEIMFAVVILGIGFIFIAAIFPVAIRQTQSSAEESVAVSAAEAAVSTISSRATESLFPPTPGDRTDPSATVPSPLPEFYPPFVAVGEKYHNSLGTAPANYYYNDPATTLAGDVDTERLARQQWLTLRGDLVSATDRRIGFAMAYARSGRVTYTAASPTYVVNPAGSMQAIMVVAQSRETPQFNARDAEPSQSADWLRDLRVPRAGDLYSTIVNQFVDDGGTPATLQFKRLRAFLWTGQNGGPDRIQFTAPSGSMMGTGDVTAVAPGCYVIVADAGGGSPTAVKAAGDAPDAPNARANGRVFRVAKQVTGATNTWELVQGQDVSSIPKRTTSSVTDASGMDRPPFGTAFSSTPTNAVEVLVLGRALQNPTLPFNAGSNPYVGSAMDIAVYTTQIGVKP